MATHVIEPERATLHGAFARDRPPALVIESGDTVRIRTLDASWSIEPPRADGSLRRHFEPRDPVSDAGHALCGPIAIRGAEPGMTLAVTIGELVPGDWGWTDAGGWDAPHNRRLRVVDTPTTTLRWKLDRAARTAVDQHGHIAALRPFLGVLGMPPDEPGFHSTAPPRLTGGNLDCRELVSGSTLYLPIAVRGGLFSAGDGHGAQGDGEVSGTAIECPMEVAELTLQLYDDVRLVTPRAETPAGWITFGFHRSVDEALTIALDAMLDLLGEQLGVERGEALALASVVTHLRVTQIVNGVCGVHALLPRNALS